MKATLKIDVEYDPKVADAESLASAADRLLETILCTPEILDDYASKEFGPPRFAKFFVLTEHDEETAEGEDSQDDRPQDAEPAAPPPSTGKTKRIWVTLAASEVHQWYGVLEIPAAMDGLEAARWIEDAVDPNAYKSSHGWQPLDPQWGPLDDPSEKTNFRISENLEIEEV